MNIFSKDLHSAILFGRVQPHPLCIDLLVTHLSFVDDVLIFFDGSDHYLAGILDVSKSLYFASVLDLNLQKSSLFLNGNNLQLSRDLSTRYGLSQGSLRLRYLDLPQLFHKLRSIDF